VRGCLEERLGIPVREVRRQHDDGAQMQLPLGYGCEDRGEPPRGSCGADPLARHVLGHMQLVQAVQVHRFVTSRPE
jgi:hypothetical protein